ncbi:MAG: Uma2 family endonuclease [Caldilineaceae bacterium]|nr:Uma2 family endonuclease [Caldilineaceae bacterium]
MSTPTAYATPPVRGQPTWEIAHLFPAQGQWSEWEYFALETERGVEFSNGTVEVLPRPTQRHQIILALFVRMLTRFCEKHASATVLPSGLRVRLWPGKFREPDVVLMLAGHDNRRGEEYWEGADLVVEVVSGSAKDRARDLVYKRQEYAQAGIPEYWIVDPETETVTVLALDGNEYTEYGKFHRGESATSKLLPGFAVPVGEVFDAK